MRRLGLFAKRPVAGAVKTRLSPALPAALARDLYAALLDDALSAARVARVDERSVWWDAPVDQAVTPGFEARLQHGADLGARLANAFARLTENGARAAIVGTDAPALGAPAIERAFDALDTHDAAFAPSSDGGYALVALARPEPALFEGIAWSTPSVFEATLAIAARRGLRVARLEPLDDLDVPRDLVRWAARVAIEARGIGPATAAALRAMGLAPPV